MAKKKKNLVITHLHHIKKVHLPKGPILCEWPNCGKSFSSKRALKLHMDTIHEPIPRFYCSFEICTKSFVYKSYLEKHEKSHQKGLSKTVKKEENKSPTAAALKEQLTGFSYSKDVERKYACPFDGCQHHFLREYDLKRHLESNLHKNDIHYFQSNQQALIQQNLNNQPSE
ncbi:hypothetical protein BJ944DRAFT_279925 [Cunninghamella echinulata]|nr:hypothetical protein BJ944DRAFT_279925 [Cunninghamella echinulata]